MAKNYKRVVVDLPEDTSTLSKMIRSGFTASVDFKKSTGVSDQLVADVLQSRSEYDCEMQGKLKELNEPDIYFPIGALKSRAQYAWIRDVVAGAMGKMWIGKPTPIPELPPELHESIIEDVQDEIALLGELTDVKFHEVDKIVTKVTKEAVDRLYERADLKIDGMSRLIEDQWEDADWRDVWSEVATDLGIYRASIVKGPVIVSRKEVSWTSTGKLKTEEKEQPIMYRVAPENWYPMPDVGHDPNSGSGVYELATITRTDLVASRSVKGFDEDAIDLVLEEDTEGYTEEDTDWMKVQSILNRSDRSEDGSGELGFGLYHCVKFYGGVSVEKLREADIEVHKSYDDMDIIETEVWMIKDHILYMVLNPMLACMRPFCVVPREFKSGSAWGGDSLQMMMRTPVRIINAIVRQHIINLGNASGPLGEVESSRIPGGVPPKFVRTNKIYPVLPSPQGNKAYRFTDIPSRSSEYMRAMEYYIDKVHDLTGIPGFTSGSPGSESRSTLGQTNFYFSNASKGIGALLDLIDRFLIEPMLDRYYYYNMQTSDDESIKGDVKWRARGLSGIFERQVKQEQSIQLVQVLSQLKAVMPSYITEESFLEIAKPVLDSVGVDIEDIISQNPQQGQEGQVSQDPTLGPPEEEVNIDRLLSGLNTSTPSEVQPTDIPTRV